jgi:hypothetical protein
MPFDVNPAGQIADSCSVTTMTSGSFTTTSSVTGTPLSSSHFYLALDFDESCKAWTSGTPTSSGDYDPATVSFTPQWAFMFPTGFAALSTDYGSGQDGVEAMGIYSVNSSSEEDGHYVTMENGSTGAGDMFGEAQHRTRLQIDEVTSTPASSSMTFGALPTFDSSGIVYADAFYTHDAGSTHQILGVFVEESTSATIVPQAAYHYNRMRNPF